MDRQMRKCSIEDLEQLCQFSIKVYRETFDGICSEEDMQAYLDDAFNKEQIQQELNNPYSTFYFLFDDNELVGYMKVNDTPAQCDIKDEKSLELQRIYIAKSAQGKGCGVYLLQQAISLAKEKEKEYLWLGVYEHNDHAIAFYKKHGFYKIGSHPFIMGDDVQTDELMRKDL